MITVHVTKPTNRGIHTNGHRGRSFFISPCAISVFAGPLLIETTNADGQVDFRKSLLVSEGEGPIEVELEPVPTNETAQMSVPASAPIQVMLDFLDEIDEVAFASYFCMRQISGMLQQTHPLYQEVASSLSRNLSDPTQQLLPAIKRLDVEKAKMTFDKHSKQGFHALFAHSVVSLWGALEGTIPKFVASVLAKNNELLGKDAFKRIRVPASLLAWGRSEDYIAAIVQELYQTADGVQKLGVGRFSTLLDAIGLQISVSSAVKRDLIELSQVRNLVAHRMSIVDQQFRSTCSWLEYSVGDAIKITLSDYVRYRAAVSGYVSAIVAAANQKA